ncbi:hypothetical protein GGS23DRAFT_404723 [Durotheca rogersii]|uniref:uncharacterized protein n=1 Tax=Durotheca rogersii TaxID=419775 RepID=UPI00222078B8|nr:uncharacterized protein GGS23DRAFT_404723 [Durotheca rogersii]KAI5865020.1 hypothetical protein GGS23DRAFT_404723 [Durotheca rogersii]
MYSSHSRKPGVGSKFDSTLEVGVTYDSVDSLRRGRGGTRLELRRRRRTSYLRGQFRATKQQLKITHARRRGMANEARRGESVTGRGLWRFAKAYWISTRRAIRAGRQVDLVYPFGGQLRVRQRARLSLKKGGGGDAECPALSQPQPSLGSVGERHGRCEGGSGEGWALRFVSCCYVTRQARRCPAVARVEVCWEEEARAPIIRYAGRGWLGDGSADGSGGFEDGRMDERGRRSWAPRGGCLPAAIPHMKRHMPR